MKRVFLFFFIAVFSATGFAQHCPFDGSTMLVVKLTDSKGDPVTSMRDSLFLAEVDNPKPDSCSFAKGILILPFKNLREGLLNKYEGAWKNWALRLSAGSEFMNPGHFAVVLNQAEHNCMITDKDDYRYIQRKFIIEIKQDNVVRPLAEVPSENFYSLCTNAGLWTRIKSMEIIIK